MTIRMIECAFVRVGDVREAEELVHLAIIAAGGLYSEPRLRMTTRYHSSERRGTIQIDTGTPEGESVGQIFLALADRAFEPGAYTLRMGTGHSDHEASQGEGIGRMETSP